jgi:hypothetical protein
VRFLNPAPCALRDGWRAYAPRVPRVKALVWSSLCCCLAVACSNPQDGTFQTEMLFAVPDAGPVADGGFDVRLGAVIGDVDGVVSRT